MRACTWILGASDPEIAAIEALLAAAGEDVAAARAGSVAGTQVDPESVYGDPARGYAGASVLGGGR